MKKYTYIVIFILIITTLFTLCSCSSKNDYVNDNRNEGTNNYSGNEEGNTVNSSSSGNSPVDSILELDPFENLIVEFDGISPYCTIAFNNSKCSKEVQTYVNYSLDPNELITDTKLEINQTVTVYAFLIDSYGNTPQYTLLETSKTYTVTDVPEYITEITEDMDLSKLKKEADDYLTSITAFSTGQESAFGARGYYVSHTKINNDNVYFSSAKINSYNKFKNDYDFFNKIDFIFSTVITADFYGTGEYPVYFTVTAKNLVRYPDGTIGWGTTDPASLSFDHYLNHENMQSLINSNITSIKTDYNVTEIPDLLN